MSALPLKWDIGVGGGHVVISRHRWGLLCLRKRASLRQQMTSAFDHFRTSARPRLLREPGTSLQTHLSTTFRWPMIDLTCGYGRYSGKRGRNGFGHTLW